MKKKNEYNIKGIKNIINDKIFLWNYIEETFKKIIIIKKYTEVKIPLLEKTSLFKSTLGTSSDIIKKEMYSFIYNKKNITLIPEGTTSCFKNLILDGELRNFKKKNVWYLSPMFRKENTQKGRNRQFYQIGIESYNERNYIKDIEHINIINYFFKKIKINDIILELNFINNEIDNLYKKELSNFILKNYNLLSKEDIKKIKFNPLRMLDKNRFRTKKNIPLSINFLKKNKKKKFIKIIYELKKLNITFVINNFLVRGLEYYNNLVYEWTSNINKKKIAICSGGNYNDLSKNFQKNKINSTGCALGIERVILKIKKKIKKKESIIIIYNNRYLKNLKIKMIEKIKKKFKNINIYDKSFNKSLNQEIKKNKSKIIIFISDKIIKYQNIILIYNKNKKIININKILRYLWDLNIKIL